MKLYNLGCADLFRCVFCRNLSNDPKIMSCMHTACLDCLQKNFDAQSSQIKCNGCDAVNTVKNIDAFGNHDYVRNVLTILSSTDKSENVFVECPSCEAEIHENTLMFTCLTCSQSRDQGRGDSRPPPTSNFVSILETGHKLTARTVMCSQCFDHHCLQNKGHAVFACVASSSGQFLSQASSRLAKCRKHKEPLVSFCLKLKRPMCDACLTSHNISGHSHLTGVELKCHVKSKVECGKRFQANIHAYNKRMENLKKGLDAEKESNAQNARKLFQKLHDILKKNEDDLIKQLDEVYTSKLSELNSIEEQGSFFANLGDRLTQTASDLLCLSSENESYSFVTAIDTVASQLTQFSAGLEEEVRQILKSKPNMNFKKRLFEDFVNIQYVSVEDGPSKFVDSICCSLSEVPESRLTQITIASDILSQNKNIEVNAEEFKVELSMPGNMPINVPVQSKETEELSESGEQVNNVKFIALVDPNVVGAGIYNLKVYHKLDLIQACPDVINVYPKYDSDLSVRKEDISSYKHFRICKTLKEKCDVNGSWTSSTPEEPVSYRPFATSSPSPDDDIELLPDEDLSPVSEQANGRGLHAMAFDEDESVIGLTNEYDDMVEQIHALDLDTEAHMVTINNIKGFESSNGYESNAVPKARRIKNRPKESSGLENNSFAENLVNDSYYNHFCERFKFPLVPGATVRVEKLFTLGVRGKNNSKEGHFQYPIGSAVSGKGEILVCDHGNNRVQIFEATGRLKCVAGKGILDRPSAVVCAENGGFAVRADNGVYFFDKDCNNLPERNLKSKSVKFCYGLAACGLDELMFVDTNRAKASLVRLNWEGKLVSTVPFQPLTGANKPSNSKCRFMDVYQDKVYVSDLGASKIYVTKLNGEILNTFGTFGSKMDQLNEPAGIKCTDGFILVSDSKNHRLKVYDQFGNTLSLLSFPHGDFIRRPSDICFGSDGVLVVNSFLTHEVFVYRLKASCPSVY
ncbi:uncharacterized protein LOC134852494 isoform X2 [Symsagittifera roscoffensis]|uniref:uncharacterized protein LOC134852494 isoform X2 n=1 Tax=Symsagittifera roscoffensis TaxID=84072 RepID=UPI00307BAD2D